MIEAGVHLGLPRATATELVVQTVVGSAKMLRETGEHPTVLREQVTSPGGTTAAALRELEDPQGARGVPGRDGGRPRPVPRRSPRAADARHAGGFLRLTGETRPTRRPAPACPSGPTRQVRPGGRLSGRSACPCRTAAGYGAPSAADRDGVRRERVSSQCATSTFVIAAVVRANTPMASVVNWNHEARSPVDDH